MPAEAQNITIVHSKNAKLSDTLYHIERIVNEFSWQVRDIAKKLKAGTVEQTSRNIWNWTRENIKYKKDAEDIFDKEDEIEELRRPARIISDGFGDCDCMTILNRSLLKECNILNASKTTAYPKKDEFGNYKKDIFGKYVSDDYSHIYALSIDKKNKQIFVIDTVPEISRFNEEYQPITKFIITPNIMELRELGGIENEIENDLTLSELIPDEQELSGFDDEYAASYETVILGPLAIVEPEKAIVTVGARELKLRVIVADLSKQKQILIHDRDSSGPISKALKINTEIDVFDQVLQAPDLEKALSQASKSKSYFAEYFGVMLENLQNPLNGIEEDEVYHLGRIDADDESEIYAERLGKIRFRKPKIFGKDGLIKRGLDKLKQISPTAIAMRAAALVVVRANVFRIADKLALGYMTEEQAKSKGYNIDAWKEFVAAREKFESKWKKFGGKTSSLKKAVVNGRAGKKAGLKGELGIVVAAGVTAALAAATPVVLAIKEIFGKLNIKKADPKDSGDEGKETGDAMDEKEVQQIHKDEMENAKTEEKENLPANQEQKYNSAVPEKKGFFAAVQENVKNNKKWWIIGSLGVVLLIILIVWLVNRKKKPQAKRKRRSLNGAQRRTIKTTTVQKKQLSGTKRNKTLNGLSGTNNHLKALHAKAKKIKAQHPRMKYSTALKKAKTA